MFLHENRQVFANSIRQKPLVLILFPQTSKHRQLQQYFPGCSTSCLPPCPQEKSSCIAAPFTSNPFLAVRSSYRNSATSHKRMGALKGKPRPRLSSPGYPSISSWQQHWSQKMGSAAETPMSPSQEPPAGSRQKINHDRSSAPRMGNADGKSSMT